jgi:hypothetical protein
MLPIRFPKKRFEVAQPSLRSSSLANQPSLFLCHSFYSFFGDVAVIFFDVLQSCVLDGSSNYLDIMVLSLKLVFYLPSQFAVTILV